MFHTLLKTWIFSYYGKWLNETENYDDDEYEYYGSDPGENHKGSEGEDDYGNITKVLTL